MRSANSPGPGWWCRWCRRSRTGRRRDRGRPRRCREPAAAAWALRTGSPTRWRRSTSTVTSLSWAIATISSICSVASALLRPTLALLNASLGGHHVFDRAQPRGDGPLGAIGAGHQRGELDVGVVAQVRGELGGVGHRRHLRRGDERGGLHLAYPGGGHRGQQFQLGRQRDWLLDLQPVAQRHLANVDVRCHSTSSARKLLELLGGLAEQPDVDVVVVLARTRRAGVANTARRFREHRHDPRPQNGPRRCRSS